MTQIAEIGVERFVPEALKGSNETYVSGNSWLPSPLDH